VIDLDTKTIQVGIIAFSAYIITRSEETSGILPNSQLFANKGDWKK
jgi:hypothetical protein